MDSFLALRLAMMYPTATEAVDLTSLDESVDIDDCDPTTSSADLRAVLADFELNETFQWQIDGGAEGFRYFTIPDFARGQPPLRIDAYVPEFASRSHPLLSSADLEMAFSASSSQVAESHAAKIVIHMLNRWSKRFVGLEDAYRSLPYGSYIVLRNVQRDLSQLRVDMIPNFAVERAWMPLDSLRKIWDLPESLLPPIVEWDRLQLERQLHENIALVRVSSSNGSSELMAYKAVLQDFQHFYHELKILLTMPPHPNVLAKPRYIVTKKGRFGSKIGVCGFLLEFHTGGTLQNALSSDPGGDSLRLRRSFSWAKQLVSASMHVHESVGFYANMKLINVVMSSDGNYGRPVLIDFEQRSGWFSWSPPEVHYIGYIEQLAIYSENPSTRVRYTSLLQKLIPSWKQVNIRAKYDNPKDGYATAWLILDNAERESAQVYMLGKLLWCIFEQAASVSSCLTLETFREPPCSQVFPTFCRTPSIMRKCIQKCTSGAPEWDGRWPSVFRIGSRLHRINFQQTGTEPTEVDLVDVQRACKAWWTEEIERAERFVETRSRLLSGEPEQHGDPCILSLSRQRPKLKHVMQTLEAMEGDPGLWTL